jgi:tetratricopeptide (TPR) repeat protein
VLKTIPDRHDDAIVEQIFFNQAPMARGIGIIYNGQNLCICFLSTNYERKWSMDRGGILVGLGVELTESDIQYATRNGIIKNCDVVHAMQIIGQDHAEPETLFSLYAARAQREGWDVSQIDNLVISKTTIKKFLRTYVVYGVYIAESTDVQQHFRKLIEEFIVTDWDKRVDFARRHPEILTPEADLLMKKMASEAQKKEAKVLITISRCVALSDLRRDLQNPNYTPNRALAVSELLLMEGVMGALENGDSIQSIAAFVGKGAHRYEAAVELFDLALEMNPKDAVTWNDKGAYLTDFLKKLEEAIKCYDRAIEINPAYADAWGNKGITLGQLGKYDQALTCFNKASELDPQNPKHQNGIEVTYKLMKNKR